MNIFFVGLLLFFSLNTSANDDSVTYSMDCDTFGHAIDNINHELSEEYKLEYSCEQVYVEQKFLFGLYKSKVTNSKIILRAQTPLCQNAKYALTNVIELLSAVHIGYNDWILKDIRKIFNDHSIYIDLSIVGGVAGLTSIYAHAIQFPNCDL